MDYVSDMDGVNPGIWIDGQFQNWNCLFKKNGIGIDKFFSGIGIEVCYKKFKS